MQNYQPDWYCSEACLLILSRSKEDIVWNQIKRKSKTKNGLPPLKKKSVLVSLLKSWLTRTDFQGCHTSAPPHLTNWQSVPTTKPSSMGIASHGRYECTQFISRYHLLLFNNELASLVASPHHSQTSRAFRTGVFSPKSGFSNTLKYWCWLKLLRDNTVLFTQLLPFYVNSFVDYNN